MSRKEWIIIRDMIFSKDFENIFIDILLPMTKPILFGVVYRPQATENFDELLAKSILDADSFSEQEVYIMGDTNYNLLDRKWTSFSKKGIGTLKI